MCWRIRLLVGTLVVLQLYKEKKSRMCWLIQLAGSWLKCVVGVYAYTTLIFSVTYGEIIMKICCIFVC